MSQEAGRAQNPAAQPTADLYVAAPTGFWLPIWRRFRKNRLGVGSGIILIILYTMAVFAPFFSPYRYDEFHGKFKFAPPQRIRVFDDQGRLTAPFMYGYQRKMDPETLALNYQEDRSTHYRVRFFVRGEPYRILFVIPGRLRFIGIEDGGTIFLLGTDVLGRDLLSRILKAAQVSLSVPLVGTLISVVLGVLLGVASGYFGGVIDDIIQRFIELLLSFPHIPLWLALSAAIPPTWPSDYVYLTIVAILSFISWGGLARVVRGKVLAYRGEEYVLAARAAGARTWRIITRHLVPGCLSHTIVTATLSIPGIILGESSLSYLGVGVTPPMTSWGVLIKDATTIHAIVRQPWLTIPGLMIIVTVLCFNFLGDAIRDAADPFST